MNMKLWLITGMVALVGFAPLAEGAKKKKATGKSSLFDKRDKDLDKKERAERDFQKLREIGLSTELPKKTESLTDDMEKLDQQVTLTDQQKTKIPAMRALRDKILANWDKVNRKKFDAMQARLEKLKSRRDMRTCKAIVTRIRSMARARAIIVSSNERKFFTALTAEQRGKWNAPVISQVLLDEFQSLELTDEQIKKIESAAIAQAKRLAVPLGSTDPPAQVIEPIKKYVYTRILTAKQRKVYALARRREKAGK
ncbi:MAG: hypothetical protein QGH60_10640 [Phycisphaerae bacterium]|jgi:hypothetical protein|nr:hypothetical protein [Phycisphaerae bacterium]